MSDYLPCAILVPSLNRPQRLREVAENIHAATAEEHFILFCVSDDESKAILDELGEWYLDDSDTDDRRYVTRMNKLTRDWLDDAKTMFFGSDDVIHHEGWLAAALTTMERDDKALVICNDLHNSAGTQAVIRRDYLQRAVFDSPGDAFHRGYLHNFADNEQFFTASMQGEMTQALGAVVEHLHPGWNAPNSMPWDDTYHNARAGWDHDLALWIERHERIKNTVVPPSQPVRTYW